MNDDDATREFTRQLFHSDEEDEPGAPTDITTGNVVPKEGATVPQPQADEMREFTRRLFHGNPDDHARN